VTEETTSSTPKRGRTGLIVLLLALLLLGLLGWRGWAMWQTRETHARASAAEAEQRIGALEQRIDLGPARLVELEPDLVRLVPQGPRQQFAEFAHTASVIRVCEESIASASHYKSVLPRSVVAERSEGPSGARTLNFDS
jgi:hypothetical protein